MKTRRVFTAALGGVCLFAGLVTGRRIYYTVFAALCFILLLSLAVTLCALMTLRYGQRISERTVQKRSEAVLRMDIQNSLPLAVSRIDLRYDTWESGITGEPKTMTTWLLPFGERRVDIAFSADYCGRFKVGLMGFTIHCPLGLYSITVNAARLRYYSPLHILVYPRGLMPDFMNLDSSLSEDRELRRGSQAEHNLQINDLRGYNAGDPLRRIHWKLSSRRQELFVKIYEDTSRPKLMLVPDCFDHGFRGLEAVMVEDAIAESAAGISNYALAHGVPVDLIAYPDEAIRIYGDSQAHFAAFNEGIAGLSFRGQIAVSEILRVEPPDSSTGVIVITTDISLRLFDEIVRLNMRGIRVKTLCVSPGEAKDELEKTMKELANQGIKAAHMRAGDDVIQAVSAL